MNFKISFFKSYIFPLLIIFLIPLSCYYFYGVAVGMDDKNFVEAVTESIKNDKEIAESQKGPLIAVVEENVPSLFCFSDELEHFSQLREQYNEFCGYLETYILLRQASFWSLVFSLIIILLVGILFAISYISQRIQYYCFVIAWNIAKIFSISQVIIQGALLVSFCYYSTVILADRFYPKIILIIGAAAAFAAFKMIIALVRKVDHPVPLKGHILRQDEAPLLYSEIEELCKKLNTNPPDNIVLGVEDNFFVTEHPLLVGEKVLSGRTLFASVLHLERLSRTESSSFLAHEMAHFSGQDTWYSKRTSPMLTRCGMYLDILNQSLVTLPVFNFLIFFRSLFELSFSKISREREKRADALAVKLLSGEDLANALAKFVLYSRFRGKVENDIFSKEEKVKKVNLLEQITSGFSSYLKETESDEELLNDTVAHPFDTHPPIAQRIKQVGVSLDLDEVKRDAINIPKDSWFAEIHNAKEIRDRLIKEYESDFMKEHEMDLAYRYLPDNDEERAIVEKHFPAVTISSKDGKYNITFDYEKISCSEWKDPIHYSNIKDPEVTESMMKEYLVFKLHEDFASHKGKIKLRISKMENDSNKIVDLFNLYYARSQTALEYSKKS